ncbi:amidohydrolase family protein [Lentiprolixibacter aurantiacus]|uniref:Amidohydrolase family protein n=1 Tax=Lentiprolixibacter aurantiacus TaxID=2993939 RepID=A0AAE3MKP9_9FLAO|nr:amidohydrolase family protein [Lentiprolixibacter aurantiacus]MCX2719188.1 amidohydrolase family protein [Lentiprolixibacter aurantiacus]
MKRILIIGLTLLSIGCSQAVEYDLVIRNVSLFNGYEDQGIVNIAINNDTIATISSEELISQSVIDGSGKYIIPGLVNAHVHVSRREQLKQGYPLGIMYLLNMHTGLEDRELDWKRISRDSSGYSVLYGSGHAATVPGGHPTQFSPEMETINDSSSVEAWLQNRIKNNVDYIKIIRDNHEWMGYPAQPTMSFDTIGKLIGAARHNGLKTVVHANTVHEFIAISKFQPSGFVHMLDYKEDLPIPESYYQAISNSGAFIVTTAGISLKPMEGAPPFMVEWVTKNLLDAEQRAEIISNYYQNDIMIVVGTDAQEGQMDFADDYYLELELYQMAGLSNLEILRAATGNAAKAFGLPIGEIKVGGKATFVLLNASPLEELSNLKKVEQVWKNGKPYDGL